MHIVVYLKANPGELTGSAVPSRDVEQLLSRARELGVNLRPMHPGVPDPSLARAFTVEVADRETADRVASALRESPAVDAAYVKPPDALP